jgi:hypothetical protein
MLCMMGVIKTVYPGRRSHTKTRRGKSKHNHEGFDSAILLRLFAWRCWRTHHGVIKEPYRGIAIAEVTC